MRFSVNFPRASFLDMSRAYLQLPFDDESSKLVTINTHKGLYKYHRLPFGITSGPAIFQRCMENLLQKLDGVAMYLVTGADREVHLRNLEAVLGRLEAAGLRLNKSKCLFKSIEWLHHR